MASVDLRFTGALTRTISERAAALRAEWLSADRSAVQVSEWETAKTQLLAQYKRATSPERDC